MVEELILAFPRMVVEAEDAQQRGLPCAARPHDRDEFALGDVEVDLAQDVSETGLGLEALFHVLEPDHWYRAAGFRGGGLRIIIHR